MSEFRLIVGLGNPGKAYQHTRHNFGFLVIEALAKRLGIKWKRSLLFKSFVAQGTLEGQKFYLLMPLTYMNRSGIVIRAFVRKKNIDLSDVLVICDDLDLEFGRLRLRIKGSGAGHKGLLSIIRELGTDNFSRLKLGIGRPDSREETVDFVLSPFRSAEEKELKNIIEEALGQTHQWLIQGPA